MSDSASYTSSYLFTSPMIFNEDVYVRLMPSYCGGTWDFHFIFEALLNTLTVCLDALFEEGNDFKREF